MDQYVRVSRVGRRSGESFISPDLQRDQGAAWAASRSVEIPVIHEDLDQSGGKLARPGLDALMARIRAGETDGVIVSKLDRLSRLGVADALRLVEQITPGTHLQSRQSRQSGKQRGRHKPKRLRFSSSSPTPTKNCCTTPCNALRDLTFIRTQKPDRPLLRDRRDCLFFGGSGLV